MEPYTPGNSPPDESRDNARRVTASRRRKVAYFFTGLLGLAAIVLITVNSGEISAFASQLRQARPAWFFIAMAPQLTTYACVAYVWRRTLFKLNSVLPVKSLYPLAIAKLFADQALPSAGISGAVFFLHALNQRGVPQKTAFSVFVFATTSFLSAFLGATMIALVIFALTGRAAPGLSASIAVFAALVILLLLIAAAVFVANPALKNWPLFNKPIFLRAGDYLRTAFHHISGMRWLFAELCFVQFLIRIIDAVTLLFLLAAIGQTAPFSACFAAVVIASMAATLGPVPMGLGTFEAGMVAVLSISGIGVENALTATLLYRGLSLWLPLLPGFFIIQREMLRIKSGVQIAVKDTKTPENKI